MMTKRRVQAVAVSLILLKFPGVMPPRFQFTSDWLYLVVSKVDESITVTKSRRPCFPKAAAFCYKFTSRGAIG